MEINLELSVADFHAPLRRLWKTATHSVLAIHQSYANRPETPVFTVQGKYVPQGWTEWTQGFQFGCALLVYDAIGDREARDIGVHGTVHRMAGHVTHIGVHDHGFNNVSTYGNMRRLIRAGQLDGHESLLPFCELALQASGAVQAARWTRIAPQAGYIYTFNGPHSLFCDTMRTLRVLALAHQLHHVLWGENDERISLLERLCQHAVTTAQYNVYYGEQRDVYDVRGRVAHESIFNTRDGNYRCPNTQQGYSPFTTWTRGLSWVMLGYPEQLEFLASVYPDALQQPVSFVGGDSRAPQSLNEVMLRAACAACDFFIDHTSADGIPFWDTGAPGVARMPDYRRQVADPYNHHEPLDSSAAAIGAQGLLRLGRHLQRQGDSERGDRYWQAGLTTAKTLLATPYLNVDPSHQGILLHTVYHRPRGWDHVPAGQSVPCGESALWGDYHLLELGLYLQRLVDQGEYYSFFA